MFDRYKELAGEGVDNKNSAYMFFLLVLFLH